MLASPGCWAAYGSVLAEGAVSPLLTPHGTLTVDAYAVQHPGVPGPQATQSVWVHLITLHLLLERGWPAEQAIRLRTIAADSSSGWSWLDPPDSMGPATAIDVVQAEADDAGDAVRAWVDGAWAAWEPHHLAIRRIAERLVDRMG